MNKRILFGLFALIATTGCMFYELVAMKPTSTQTRSESIAKLQSDVSAAGRKIEQHEKTHEKLREAKKEHSRLETLRIETARVKDEPGLPNDLRTKLQVLERNTAEKETEAEKEVQKLQEKLKLKKTSQPTEITSTVFTNPTIVDSTKTGAQTATSQTIITTDSGKERIVQAGDTIFTGGMTSKALTTTKTIGADYIKSAEAEDLYKKEKPKSKIVGDVEVLANTQAPSSATIAGWKAEQIAEKSKTPLSNDSQALVVRKTSDIIAVKSDTSVDTKAAKPLDSVTGALVPYTGKSSELATTSADEKKSGMSGKQKAAVGAGVVGAGVVGVGLIGAGLIGAGLLGAGLSGDKDKPTEGIAPEKVEDIKGLDVGSGASASFEPSPITD